MKLEIDKTHKTGKVNAKKLVKNAAIGLSLLTAVTLFSGCGKKELNNTTIDTLPAIEIQEEIENEKEPETVEETTYVLEEETQSEPETQPRKSIVDENGNVMIDESNKGLIKTLLKIEGDTITVDDLKEFKSLSLKYEDGIDLSFLNYCDNLESMSIFCYDCPDQEFNNLKVLDNLNSASIYVLGNDSIFNEENYNFLKNVNDLTLNGIQIEGNDYLYSLENLKKLNIEITDKTINDIDYTKLGFLEEIDFSDSLAGNIAINLTSNEYNYLKNSNVVLKFKEADTEEEIINYNDKLDKVVESLNIREDATDKEKLNAMLIYILENLEYDENVSAALENADEDYAQELSKPFAENGLLYPSFNMDSAICCNYAALVEALAKRIDLDTSYIRSKNHAWNVVNVEGENFYVDATWLDDERVFESSSQTYVKDGKIIEETNISSTSSIDKIKQGETEDLKWYLKNMNDEMDISHQAVYVPSYMQNPEKEENEHINHELNTEEETQLETKEEIVKETQAETKEEIVKETQEKEISNKKFNIEVNGKTLAICGGALVGILSGLGLAIGISNKKKKERMKRERMNQYYNNSYNSFSSYNSFGSNNSYRRY